MKAYYEKRDVAINEIDAMTLYVVYYEAVRGDGYSSGNIFKPFGAYSSEEMAIAVTNAINKGII